MVRAYKNVFVCEVCGLGYRDEKTAVECEEYCNKFNSCNIDIAKKAVLREI